MRWMRWIVVMLAVLSVLAGVGLSLAPIGPCNHSLWQWACVVVLMPTIAAAACFFDANSWTFQRMLFLAGGIQAGVFIGLYYLLKKAIRRIWPPPPTRETKSGDSSPKT